MKGSVRLTVSWLLIVLAAQLSGCGRDIYREFSDLIARPAFSTDEVTVTFLGVSSMLFRDGSDAILIDGFFTRPGWRKMLSLHTDPARVTAGLQLAGLNPCPYGCNKDHKRELTAVVAVHSHHDHAMDIAEVAFQTGADIYGSKSARFIALGGGVPADRIFVLEKDKPVSIGRFEVIAHLQKHGSHLAVPFIRGEIKEELRQPVSVLAYKEGAHYSLSIKTSQGVVIVHASAGYPESAYENNADAIVLGIGNLKKKKLGGYWDNTVNTSGAKAVYPVHWDNFTKPLSPRLQSLGGSAVKTINEMKKLAQENNVQLKLLPVGQPVRLFPDS